MCTSIRFTNGGPFGCTPKSNMNDIAKEVFGHQSLTDAKPHTTRLTFKLDSIDDNSESEDEED